MSKVRFISVCSGIEAATVAWSQLGWKPQFYSEFDKFPSEVLAYRHPEVPNLGDMTKIKEWNDYETDVLVGGTPCQSFSVAGLRKGLDDPRGNLMLTYLAIADRYRPTWVVWENVPGVLSSNGGRDFGTFLGGLEQLGYGFAHRVLDAQYCNLAQRRERVFVVGCLGSWQRAAAVLFEQHSLSWNIAPSREKGERITPSVTTSPPFSRTENSRIECEALVVNQEPICFKSKASQEMPSKNERGGICPTLQAENPMAVAFTQNDAGRDATVDLAPTLRSGGDGGIPQQCVAFSQNTRNELIESDISPALSAGGGKPGQGYSAIRNNMQVRRLTEVECERLQGFPDNYTQIPWRGKPKEDCPGGHRYKALGNSMAVPVMKWIGERIDKVEEIR